MRVSSLIKLAYDHYYNLHRAPMTNFSLDDGGIIVDDDDAINNNVCFGFEETNVEI
jgi:hypothetical protein